MFFFFFFKYGNSNENGCYAAFSRAILTRVSKVICVYFAFALLRSVIGLKNSRRFLNQSEVKPKPIVTCLRKFPRALRTCFEF